MNGSVLCQKSEEKIMPGNVLHIAIVIVIITTTVNYETMQQRLWDMRKRNIRKV